MNKLSRRSGSQEMKIVCAWCSKDLGEKNGGGAEGVSHGLCEECFNELIAEVEKRISAEGEQDEQRT